MYAAATAATATTATTTSAVGGVAGGQDAVTGAGDISACA